VGTAVGTAVGLAVGTAVGVALGLLLNDRTQHKWETASSSKKLKDEKNGTE
jgi:hypothetical protein